MREWSGGIAVETGRRPCVAQVFSIPHFRTTRTQATVNLLEIGPIFVVHGPTRKPLG
jgi:hypothetical protein